MRQWINWLFTIQHPDEQLQIRGRNLIGLLGLGVLLIIPITLFSLFFSNNPVEIIAIVIVAIGNIIQIGFVRRGYVVQIALIQIIVSLSASCASALANGQINVSSIFFIIPTLISGLILSARASLFISTLSVGVMLLLWRLMESSTPQLPVNIPTLIVYSIVIHIVITIFVIATTIAHHHALQNADQARMEAVQAREELAQSNQLLEQRVAERTAELQRSMTTQSEQGRLLQENLEQQQRLTQLLRETTIPVIPISREVLVVPLVGSLEEGRAQDLIERVLPEVERHRAQAIIVDITGVPVIDTAIAGSLIQLAHATRLLGAQSVLVGIRPEVAQALVSLGVELEELSTAATLQQGLELVGSSLIRTGTIS